MPTYSYTRLTTYENCPRQYKLRYIDRIRPPEGEEGIEAFLGKRVHDTLEKLHKELILTKLNSLGDLLDYYREQWDRNWHDGVVVVKKEYTRDHYRNSGTEAIENYYRRHHPFNQSRTLATEKLITFRIDEYSVQGYIDRLGFRDKGVYEIHDYKTSGHLPTQDHIDSDRQLALYQIGIKQQFKDAGDVQLVWHYLLFDKEFRSTRTDEQLDYLKRNVAALIKTIERDTTFEPIESGLCDWCEFPDYCSAKKHELEVQDLLTNEYLKDTGVTLVNRYAAVKTALDELKEQQDRLNKELDLIAEAAIAYAKQKGISKLTGSDFLLRIIEKTTLDFPKAGDENRESLETILKSAGIWEIVSVLNLSRLSKAILDDEVAPEIREDLLKYATQTDKSSVKLSKKKPFED